MLRMCSDKVCSFVKRFHLNPLSVSQVSIVYQMRSLLSLFLTFNVSVALRGLEKSLIMQNRYVECLPLLLQLRNIVAKKFPSMSKEIANGKFDSLCSICSC